MENNEPGETLKNAVTVTALLMMVATLILPASPAEARRVAAGCGTRGCAAVGRKGAVAVRRAPVARRVVVVNPHRYWRTGGAIAAGAAVGFVAGAAAVSLAGTPPKPGYGWYYTSANKTTGFWDICPK
ncbi:hypothetical protein [Pararhizobium sp. DWP1-1-3]|uniref:hypothetical protein n=1 Tax=Pararhizobium sp. DWP1-1-3 TaxID=2804652 RepID=UPI003CEFCA38